MNSKVSLAEAASFLGVSKQTLRNWDKAGKLTPRRDPKNNYRYYALDDLQSVKEDEATYIAPTRTEQTVGRPKADHKANDYDLNVVRQKLGKLHNIIRDTSASSSIVERFDEIAKLLFLRALVEQGRIQSDLFSDLFESESQHAEKLVEVYASVAEKFSGLIPEKFRTLKLSDVSLKKASPILEDLPVSSSQLDVKGLAFEEVIRNTFEKGDNQQFFTPHAVTEFAVSMLGQGIGESVCDPACGTGGFLVEVLKQNWPVKRISGLEIDQRLAWIAGVNLLSHGGQDFTICTLDGAGSLGSAGQKFCNSFDTIITNPPFGSDLTDKESLQLFQLGKSYSSRRRGILFIEQCLNMLRPEGRLAIVIDEGVLSLPSASDVRSFLLSNYTIEAIVALPETTFMPYASVNTSILVVKNSSPAPQHLTFFARAANVGRKANGDADYIFHENGRRTLNNDLPKIIEVWRHFVERGRVEESSIEAYAANLGKATSEDDNRIDFQYHHPSRFDAIRALETASSPIHSLFEICEERRESIIPRSESPTPSIPFTGLAHIESHTGHATQIETQAAALKSAVKKYYPGDILYARMRPNLRKCHLVSFPNPGYTSAECVVLTPRKNNDGEFLLNPTLLSVLLRSDLVYGQIIHKVAGIGRPRVSVKDLRHVRIPVPSFEDQRALLAAYSEQSKAANTLRREAHTLLEEADSTQSAAINSLTSAFCR